MAMLFADDDAQPNAALHEGQTRVFHTIGEMLSEDDAQRIVACVNARAALEAAKGAK